MSKLHKCYDCKVRMEDKKFLPKEIRGKIRRCCKDCYYGGELQFGYFEPEDIYICNCLFSDPRRNLTPNCMIWEEWTIKFGKHKGEKFRNIPTDYLVYMYKQKSFSNRCVCRYINYRVQEDADGHCGI